MTTQVIFIEVLNGSYKKVVTTSDRAADVFCKDAVAYYKRNSIKTVWVENEDNPDFYEVRSCRNGKTMVAAGPAKDELFWRKHTSIKKAVEEANGIPQKPKGQKFEFYAVISAEFTGFVLTWAKCKELTDGKSSKFKGFNGLEQAKAWMRENHAASNTFEHITDLKQIK